MIAIPLSLTVLRLFLGPLAIVWALHNYTHLVFAPLLLVGMLSDIFDGILARKLGVVRPWLRRFDSVTDVIFYLCVLATTWMVAGDVLKGSLIPLCLLLASELACITIGLVRFGSFPATHCYSAKVYGLALCFAFAGVLSFGLGPWVFVVLTLFGLVANAEVIAILFLSSSPKIDLRSVLDLKPSQARSS